MRRFSIFEKKATFTGPLTNLIFIIPACFFIIGVASILFGVTEAKFLDKSKDSFVVQAGTWWDGSDLTILDQSSHEKDACSSHELHFQITNNGYSMLDTTAYQLYYSQEDKPIQTGNITDEGTISPISENDQETLMIAVSEEGFYQLKVEQRPFYQDNEENISTISSQSITIQCEEEPLDESTETDEDKKTPPPPAEPSNNDEKESLKEESQEEVTPTEEEETEQTEPNETIDENKDHKKEEKTEQISEDSSPPANEIESDTNKPKEGMEDEIKNGEREVKENNDAEKDLEVSE